MMNVEKQPHVGFGRADARPVCIVVGDPGRAKMFASLCDSNHKELAYNREYRTFLCKKDGQEFLVASHGVGSAGAAICFTELITNGVKVLIRAGTCGSLQPKLHKQGDVVIAYAAAKEDGPSALHEPQGMPAVATPSVTNVLVESAAEQKVAASLAISASSDLFYAPMVKEGTLKTWQKCKADVIEMEVSTLFTICRLYGVRTGAVLAVDGCPFGWEDGDYDPASPKLQKAKENMAAITIAAAVKLSKEYA